VQNGDQGTRAVSMKGQDFTLDSRDISSRDVHRSDLLGKIEENAE
jgi:hypothetical protein